MLTNPTVVIISQYVRAANHHAYTLNLHNVICQLHLINLHNVICQLHLIKLGGKDNDVHQKAVVGVPWWPSG